MRRPDLRDARVASDALTTWAAWATTLVVLTDLDGPTSMVLATAAAIAVPLVVAALHGYSPSMGIGRTLQHRLALRASIFAGGLVVVVDQFAGTRLDLVPVIVAIAASATATQAGRALVDRREVTLRRRGDLQERVLLVADGDTLYGLVDMVAEQPDAGWKIVACCGTCAQQASALGIAHAGSSSDLVAHVERWGASLLVVSAEALIDDDLVGEVIAVRRTGTEVQVDAGLRGLDASVVRPMPIGHDTVLCLEPPRLLGCQRFAKRALDIVVAVATLIVVSPVLIVTALAIKLEDGGPVLFRQRRVGRSGTTFLMPKFRSMCVDAEEKIAELRQLNERDGVLFKMQSDPRVTRVGRVIRALSIDEFPQLVSVLRGDMSLIGPRPALPEEVAMFDQRLTHRHDVQPGITGLWQVEARDSESFDTYRRLDIFYVENWSLLLDLSLLLHTVPAVLERGLRSLRTTTSVPATETIGSGPSPRLAVADDEVTPELMNLMR